ncbi:hypothetical protein BD626DRAFT_241712 [Schizophyllum amplum]|uniref:Uncharacterized protein n=1 Tax=Schizophyllum amplum TaxID=97359 RepID=A0A550BW13_9AGAR|nr:hypothetical protein BD626DRAFT_241712 [Auriculariopsis ampla]
MWCSRHRRPQVLVVIIIPRTSSRLEHASKLVIESLTSLGLHPSDGALSTTLMTRYTLRTAWTYVLRRKRMSGNTQLGVRYAGGRRPSF